MATQSLTQTLLPNENSSLRVQPYQGSIIKYKATLFCLKYAQNTSTEDVLDTRTLRPKVK